MPTSDSRECGSQNVVRDPIGCGEQPLERGAVVCFPSGPDGAHKVLNRGEHAAHVLMFSSAREPAVAIYPDSDKIGIWPGNEADNVILNCIPSDDQAVSRWDLDRTLQPWRATTQAATGTADRWVERHTGRVSAIRRRLRQDGAAEYQTLGPILDGIMRNTQEGRAFMPLDA